MSLLDTLRIIGAPETHKVMAGELSRLAARRGCRPPAPERAGTGILRYPFDPQLAYTAVYYQRTATRVLWDLYESRATRLEPLYHDLVADVAADARAWAQDGFGISVEARNVAAFAAGERQIVGTVKNALVDGAAQRGLRLHVAPEDPDVRVLVRMHDDAVTVSIDLAGRSLSQRGYRTRRAEASMREHLAAVLVMLSRYDARREPLVDPMCGAGTIAIEAALMGMARPLWVPPLAPALHRLPPFAAMRPAEDALFPDTSPRIFASDVDGAAVRAARANAKAAGVGREVTVMQADFRDVTVVDVGDEPGVILSNPPYGERLGGEGGGRARGGDRGVERLYRDLGAWCRRFRGWRAGFLVANPEFERAFGMRARVKKPLSNPPLRGYFYLFEL